MNSNVLPPSTTPSSVVVSSTSKGK
jgi:hypothetical protein